MHRLIINKLGPIEHCELECSQFMTLTGFQASGKSTVAKAIYYFRTIKEDIEYLAKNQALKTIPVSGLDDEFGVVYRTNLEDSLKFYLRDKFIRTFGSVWEMSDEMSMEYYYTDTCYIKILLMHDNLEPFIPKYILISFSDNINKFLNDKNNSLSTAENGVY